MEQFVNEVNEALYNYLFFFLNKFVIFNVEDILHVVQ